MLVLGEIISLPSVSSNLYTVRLPVFEGPGNMDDVPIPAVAAIPPGVYGGLQVNDKVIVGFELNKASRPIILGKLFEGVPTELAQDALKGIKGSSSCDSLVVTKSAVLPTNTRFSSAASGVDLITDAMTTQDSLDSFQAIKERLDFLTAAVGILTMYNPVAVAPIAALGGASVIKHYLDKAEEPS